MDIEEIGRNIDTDDILSRSGTSRSFHRAFVFPKSSVNQNIVEMTENGNLSDLNDLFNIDESISHNNIPNSLMKGDYSVLYQCSLLY